MISHYILGTTLRSIDTLSHFIHIKFRKIGTIINPILNMRKLRADNFSNVHSQPEQAAELGSVLGELKLELTVLTVH